jgi:hypothetical protein
MLSVLKCKTWLTTIEQYALLLAAVCHDIGHMGTSNLFLIETGDAKALCYNDKSPLENMHCATLFDICKREDTQMFGQMDRADYKSARKVCISAILHTDLVHHNDMVKQIDVLYDLQTETCNAQAKDPGRINPDFATDVLQQNAELFIEFIMHQADISSQLKPWSVCFAWANGCLEEFFAQGDEEKRLGLPIGMLNDREKVNRAFSQIGFIEFLVTPLIFAVVRVLPPLDPCATRCLDNMRCWLSEWAQDVNPSEEEQKSVTDRIAKLETKFNYCVGLN